jgi:diphthamide synthase (EF-2-diphthine--ammonia ligase)
MSVDGPALAWSGGKDAALALWALQQQGQQPAALLTTVTADFDRSASTRARSTRRSPAATTTSACSPTCRPGVDPCGENGEFHTFVTAGPALRAPVACRRGEVVERDGFVFADLLGDG